MFKVWMDILKAKDDSVLWLLETEDIAKNNLLSFAKSYEIEKNRIIISKKVPNAEHIRRQMRSYYS